MFGISEEIRMLYLFSFFYDMKFTPVGYEGKCRSKLFHTVIIGLHACDDYVIIGLHACDNYMVGACKYMPVENLCVNQLTSARSLIGYYVFTRG